MSEALVILYRSSQLEAGSTTEELAYTIIGDVEYAFKVSGKAARIRTGRESTHINFPARIELLPTQLLNVGSELL